jgi:hypothetical protein
MTKRRMAEITYRDEREPLIEQFEELYELHHILEVGPNCNEIEQIVVTLNRSTFVPRQEDIAGSEPT